MLLVLTGSTECECTDIMLMFGVDDMDGIVGAAIEGSFNEFFSPDALVE
jgi:hypothetical protein